MIIDMSAPVVQTVVAEVVGVSKQAISAMVQEGKLPACETMGQMISAYCERLRDQAAGRLGDEAGGLDLVQERAALAREQRIAQKMKNDVASGEYAPIGLLSDVLGVASSAVVDRFDQLEGTLRKSCPGIDDEVMTVVMRVVASARNEWIRSTVKLVTAAVETMVDDEDDELVLPDLSEGIV
jgi:phage terminase Nu1 subunit (DNA packaging protein)